MGDDDNRPGRSFMPVRLPPLRNSASPMTLGLVTNDGLGGDTVKDPSVIAAPIEAGVGRKGEDGGESSPLVFLRGEVGGDSPMTWSRLGKFA